MRAVSKGPMIVDSDGLSRVATVFDGPHGSTAILIVVSGGASQLVPVGTQPNGATFARPTSLVAEGVPVEEVSVETVDPAQLTRRFEWTLLPSSSDLIDLWTWGVDGDVLATFVRGLSQPSPGMWLTAQPFTRVMSGPESGGGTFTSVAFEEHHGSIVVQVEAQDGSGDVDVYDLGIRCECRVLTRLQIDARPAYVWRLSTGVGSGVWSPRPGVLVRFTGANSTDIVAAARALRI